MNTRCKADRENLEKVLETDTIFALILGKGHKQNRGITFLAIPLHTYIFNIITSIFFTKKNIFSFPHVVVCAYVKKKKKSMQACAVRQ